MSDDGSITITVPVTEAPGTREPFGDYVADGERWVWANAGGREVHLRVADIAAAVDRARAEPDLAAARIAHLEGLLHAGDAALEALGVPNHGEPIAERIAKAGHLQSALFRKLREHQEAHVETLGEIAKALDDAGAPDGMPLPERVRALRAADLATVDRVAAAYPPHFAGARHVLGLVREEMAKGPPALSDAEMAAHRGLDAPTRADDEPDPETGWTRAEMRAASSPATRDFLAAMDKLQEGGSEADGLEAFKAFLRAEHAR